MLYPCKYIHAYTHIIYNVHTYMNVYLHFMPVLQLWWTYYSPKDLQLHLNIYKGQYSESGLLPCEVLSLLDLMFCLLWSVFFSFSHSILTSVDTNLYFCLISYLATTRLQLLCLTHFKQPRLAWAVICPDRSISLLFFTCCMVAQPCTITSCLVLHYYTVL